MLVLAVDTATPAVTAGLVELEQAASGSAIQAQVRAVASRVRVDPRAHAEVLTPQILECLTEAGRSRTHIAAVVVGIGPGPFTGLRVGMATAAAFGDALGIPVYGVCSLDAIASDVVSAADLALDGELLVVTDARRREVYWARYRDDQRVAGPEVSKPADLAAAQATGIAGSASHVDFFDLPVLPVETPSPAGLVRVAAAEILARAVPEPVVPLYLRRPDAVENSYRTLDRTGVTTVTIRIEPMNAQDIARCVELEQALFPEDDPWQAVAFRSELAGPHNRYFIARDDEGRMVGYAGIALLGDAEHPEAEVHTIGVDPVCHRAGIGTLLLDALLQEAGRRGGPVFLEVRTDNAPAIALYAKHGFHIIGLRKSYYQPSGADAYTMRRPQLMAAPQADAEQAMTRAGAGWDPTQPGAGWDPTQPGAGWDPTQPGAGRDPTQPDEVLS